MTPSNFLDLAERLARESGPAERRTATSRAYYSVFHCASSLMRSIGLTLPVGPECHKKVGFILDGGIASELTRIKRLLDSLRRERNIADYELSNGRAESATAVDLSLDMAREALMILGEYFPGKSKESAADEMRRYAMNVLKLPVK